MNGHDPIEEFFARERAAITREPADDERWQQIVAAGQRGRSQRWRTFAAAAAAAVLVGGVGYAVGRGVDAGGTGTVAGHGASTTSSLSSAPSQATTSPPLVTPSTPATTDEVSIASTPSSTPVTGALPMPQTFKALSMSQADGNTVFALGVSRCTDKECLVVARSQDNGGTWKRVATVTTGAPSTAGTGVNGSFSQIRMANATTGWIFGDAVLQTRDGGLSWTAYDHAGASVLDVAVDGDTAAIVSSADSCDGKICGGDLQLQFAPVAAAQAKSDPVSLGVTNATKASIAWWKGRAILSALADGATSTVVVDPVSGRSTINAGCPAGAATTIVRPGSGNTLLAMCQVPEAGGTTALTVRRSDDDGATWTESGERTTLVAAPITSFAATDPDHIVALAGGETTFHGDLVRTADGGKHWAVVSNPGLPESGWRWVGAPGPDWFYLLPVDGAKGYYWSHDKGATWAWTDMAG